MPTELPLDALEMALWTRARAGADASTGSSTTPTPASSTPRSATPTGSPTPARSPRSARVGDSYDNALAESVIGLYKTECVRRDGPCRSVDDLELATLSWVALVQQNRLHSAIGHVPPDRVRDRRTTVTTPRQHPLPGEPSLH